MSDGRRANVAAVVLTKNEEANLGACLDSLRGWCAELFVVDSGSTDRTREIAAAAGARVEVHPFETHARQWEWALAELPIQSGWVLAVDADQRIPDSLRDEIGQAVAGSPEGAGAAGYFIRRRQFFRGCEIRHGGYGRKYLLKLGRRASLRVRHGDAVDHHFVVDGPTGRLENALVEDNRNEDRIAEWIAKHTRYAYLQALEEHSRIGTGYEPGRLGGNPDERANWWKGRWQRLPRYVRPFLYFGYRYVLRLGFLDGKQGLVFHFMQALWYRLLVDIYLDELAAGERRARSNQTS